MENLILGAMGILIVLIPVAGLTLRFALRPVVESVARLMELRATHQGSDLLEKRVALLEQELDQVRRLAEGAEFDRRLTEEANPSERDRR